MPIKRGIGFDLDGVIVDFIGGVQAKFGPPTIPGAYSLYQMYPNVPGSALAAFVANPKEYHDLHIIPGAKAGLGWLASYANIFYITARPGVPGMFRATWKWLFEKHDFPFGPLYLIPWNDKAKFIVGLGLDMYVEDSPEHIKSLTALGVNVVAYSQPWNQGRYPRVWWKEGDNNDTWNLITTICGGAR